MKTLVLAAFAVIVAFACPAFAEKPTSAEPPSPGSLWQPSAPRFVCTEPFAMSAIFGRGRSTSQDRVIEGQIAAEMTTVNGRPLCYSAIFKKPVTVLESEKIGGFTLRDGRVFDAWTVRGRFESGRELYIFWPQLVPDVGI